MPLQASEHNRKDDRILVLKKIEGKHTLASSGLIDNRLFSNENNLHAVMDPTTCLWTFKYDSGTLPASMRGQWTSFSKLYDFAKTYFHKRNIEIVNVLD